MEIIFCGEMDIFTDQQFLIIPNILGKSRAELFCKRLKEHGGRAWIFNAKLRPTDLSVYTHIITDPALTAEQLRKVLGAAPPENSNTVVVSYKWLSRCLEQKALLEIDNSDLTSSTHEKAAPKSEVVNSKESETGDNSPPAKRKKNYQSKDAVEVCSSYDDLIQTSQDDPKPGTSGLETTQEAQLPGNSNLDRSKFICMSSSKASTETRQQKHVNEHIISKLQEMVDAYKSTKDKWRVFSYEKAIIALKSSKERIDTFDKAMALPNVGKSLAEKIAEISESGSLHKLEVFQSSDSLKSIQLFMRIWGVGPETANQWANQGFRTLDDIREKAKLTSNQKVGLKYFEGFDERMLRDEVAKIESVVCEAVHALDPALLMVTCGSYRRGKSTCGDVDVLVTHPDGKSHTGVFNKLLNSLHEQDFLTDDLTVQPNMTGGMAKYLGVCKLDEPGSKHRRIDIIVTPYSQYGCCLIYFTGSAHFNRSMRLMADKMGMSLTEHALYKDVIRGPNKEIIHHGIRVHTPTEESVFKYLGIPYRPPEERDHE